MVKSSTCAKSIWGDGAYQCSSCPPCRWSCAWGRSSCWHSWAACREVAAAAVCRSGRRCWAAVAAAALVADTCVHVAPALVAAGSDGPSLSPAAASCPAPPRTTTGAGVRHWGRRRRRSGRPPATPTTRPGDKYLPPTSLDVAPTHSNSKCWSKLSQTSYQQQSSNCWNGPDVA